MIILHAYLSLPFCDIIDFFHLLLQNLELLLLLTWYCATQK